MGLVDEAILELNLARRDDPDHLETCARLAELYLDQGLPLQAAHLWSGLAQRRPQDPRAYQELGRVLEEAKDFAKALEVYRQALEKTADPRFQGLIKNLDFLQESGEPPAPPPQTEQLLPQPHHLVAFTTMFAGREGVYARQWVSPTGESGYTPVHEPLTLKVAENHILGNYTIGVYPVRLDHTVNFIAFDLDVAKFALRRAIASQSAWQAVMARVHRTAGKLLDLGAAHDLPMHLEDSGFKGRHVWIFLDTPIPAGVAKKCGDMLAAQLSPLPTEVTLEVFPKQGSVPKGGLGNLIKLPLGFHKRTGKRALFIQADGNPWEDQLAFLEKAARASRRAVYALIQRLQAARTQPVAPLPAPDAEEPPFDPGPAAAPAPRPLPTAAEVYRLEQDPQLQYLLSQCQVLHALAEKVNRTATLTNEETLVLIHTLGHLEHGPQAVNELFQRCLQADPALFLKSRLRGHPMSCPKIRARVPHLTATVNCNCPFDLAVNLYPTPLIHIHSFKAGDAAPMGLTVDSLQFNNLLQEYLKLRQQMRENQILLERYEKKLEQFFADAGVDAVQTPMGRLRCSKDAAGRVALTLEI
jgi:hypothetical protein